MVRMVRKFVACLGLAAALAVAAGMPPTAFAEPKPGGTLVWVTQFNPRHLNSAVQSGVATGMPAAQIFASPLRYDDKWNPQPYLAESWSVAADGLSVTLHLVKNATFHDGKPVTSKDVAFSVKTVKEHHPFKSMFEPVTAVETPDPYTAILRLAHPHPAILLAMSPALLPILPEHIYGDGQDPKTHPANMKPIGAGPFKVEEFKSGDYITLVRNENYFLKGRPYLDRIVVRVIPDGANRAITMERGEGHLLAYEDQLREIARLQKLDHLAVTDKGYEGVGALVWLAFNTRKEPLNNKAVRQAISYAIDKSFITKALMLGLGTRAYGPIAPGSPFASSALEPYELDLDKANRLLDEAGFKRGADGVRFSITVDYIPGSPLQKSLAEYLKPQLKKIGIQTEPRPSPDFPTWAQRVSNHDFDTTIDAVFNWGDPVIGVHRTYLSSNIQKGVIWSNTQSYANSQVDQLLQQAARELNPDVRKQLYNEFQRIVVDDAPISYLALIPYRTVYHRGLANVPENIWGVMSPLDEVYWETPPK
ncbi:MAG TPA: ABC transporter substrate-binding protein [Candidatus Competibacteraceae bacterium]|nr:ABC transporter substrate-binding protein [Candidatus Competibacteraceae bacterium]